MELTILDSKTSERLDGYQTDEWLHAVQYVERNKQNYKEKGCSEVLIMNYKDKLHCRWELTDEVRTALLNDTMLREKASSSKKQLKFNS